MLARAGLGLLPPVICLLGAVLVAGCLGPEAVRQTRLRYNHVVQATNNEELLLNLLRLRYGECVSFLPLTAVNAQFELDAGSQVTGGLDRADRTILGLGRLDYADRPTLTFDPRRTPEL